MPDNPSTSPQTPRANTPSVNGWNAEYLDAGYQQYRRDPTSLPADMRAFFAGFDLGQDGTAAAASTGGRAGGEGGGIETALRAVNDAYRQFGHFAAQIDPLGQPRPGVPQLELSGLGVTGADLSSAIPGGGTLGERVEELKRVYCGSIGAEFWYAETPEERQWFVDALEGHQDLFTRADRERILRTVTRSETFERWLGKRYQGKKRFSLEGGESLIPMLIEMTARAGAMGVKEIILGMAHRGRLNVLRNYLGKDSERLITEFEDSWADGSDQGGGDVKYHRGYSGDQATAGGNVHLSMLNNPSHLESVNALVLGRARARQDMIGRSGIDQIVAVTIHGDAALSGQGVVAETLNMARLEGYDVGGTVHLVINNQVGFTTDPEDDRSTVYCTDIAKFINAPVLHVNGDDPEACVRAALLAIEYRQKFRKDIFVDLCCFRLHGHNEQDEPAYTQPSLYKLVRAHPGTRAVYAKRLEGQGAIAGGAAEAMVEAEIAELDKAQDSARKTPMRPVPPPGGGAWTGFVGKYTFETPATAVDAGTVRAVCEALGRAPEGFNVHPKLKGLLESRGKLPATGKLNHADSELIAFGTLLLEGTPIRLSGQDSRRGTFTQRHAVLRDEKTGEKYTPLNDVREKQARLEAWDSPLSEYGVMGFDYGYSRANPKALVLWEGQFGDFCNTAQVIIDQYMASSEVKWDRWGGLVLLLPHGYEGQGPEHSSARLERFLMLCADDNMEVIYPSTGAQYFHALRRHVKRNFRKPLVVMTPKKFLRIETATIDELSTGTFRHLIDDTHVTDRGGVKKVIYCSGKVYHELHERREALGRQDVAMVRVEQLYPFHAELARKIDAGYPSSATRVWVQEESRNAGAYLYIADAFREKLGIELGYVGRPASASPATGSEYAHKKQQEKILTAAIGALAADAGKGPAKAAEPAKDAAAAKAKAATKAGR